MNDDISVAILLSSCPKLWEPKYINGRYQLVFRENVHQWCIENDIPYEFSENMNKLFSSCVLFRNKKDASLFKLRWM